MDAEAPAGFVPVRAFARTRQAPALLVVAAALGLLTSWLGLRAAAVPTATGADTVPIWRLLVLGAALLPAIGLHSPLHALEEVAAAPQRRLERRYLCAMWLLSAGLYLALPLITVDAHLLAIMARAYLGWSGLALISGRLIGWRLAWALPTAALLPLLYWGGPATAWWAFTDRPHDHPASWVLSVGLLALGALTYRATTWRLRPRQERSGPAPVRQHTDAEPPDGPSWSGPRAR